MLTITVFLLHHQTKQKQSSTKCQNFNPDTHKERRFVAADPNVCRRHNTVSLNMHTVVHNTQIYTLFLVSNAFELFVRRGLHSHFLSVSYCDFYLQGIFKNKIHEIEANKAELLNTITEFFYQLIQCKQVQYSLVIFQTISALVTLCGQIYRTQYMPLTHAEDLVCPQLHTVGSQFFPHSFGFHSLVRQQNTRLFPGSQLKVIQNIIIRKLDCSYGSTGFLHFSY